MQRMSHLIEHEVGDVHDVVDRTLADGHQSLLHPVGRRAHLHIFQRNADIAGRQVRRLNHDGNRFAGTGFERAHVRQRPFHGNVVLHTIGIKVAGHADMAGTVHAVRRQADLEERVFLELQLLPGRSSHHGGGIEYHDAGMVAANTQFVFGANHAEAFDTADLRTFDLEFAAVVGGQFRADGRQQDLLPLGHVGRTADDLQELGLTRVEFRYMEMVGVGMRHAFHHFRHDDAGQAAGNLFHSFHVFHFQSRGGQDGGDLFRRQVELQIIFQPVK